MNHAWSKGMLKCPECGTKPTQAPVDTDTLLRCEACGYESLPGDWYATTETVRAARPDQIPAGTLIRREGVPPGDCVWHIPASGKFGFFLFFGTLWMIVTVGVTCGFLFGDKSGQSDTEPWFIYPFFAVFWAVGIGTLYIAVRNKYASYRIIVTRNLVTLAREMFGKVKEKSLDVTRITSVDQVVFYQQNYQPVYGVEIRGQDGKLRFGTMLEQSEKAWLVADIRRAVFGERASPPAVAISPEFVASKRQSSFSFPLPPTPKWQWIMGLVLMLLGLGALAFGLFAGPSFSGHGKDGADWFEAFFFSVIKIFSLIPILVGLLFGAIGMVVISSTWSGRNRDVRLEGDETQVALRTYQYGRVIKEQSFARSSVSGVRATGVGQANSQPMKRIDLIVDGKAVPVTKWTAGDVADAWAAEVVLALGKPH